MKKRIISFFAGILAFSLAFASPSGTGELTPVASASCSGLSVATGKKDVGYSKLFANINAVCGKVVTLCEVNTDGGLSNISTVLPRKKADLGFATVDVWQSYASTDENVAALRRVATLNFNYLHPVVLKKGFTPTGTGFSKLAGMIGMNKVTVIKSVDQARGMPVAVVGTARGLTRKVSDFNQYNYVFDDAVSNGEALTKLRSGEVAMAFIFAGWPVNDLDDMTKVKDLALADFNGRLVDDNQTLRTVSYESMMSMRVPTLAIRNVLFTRQFAGDKAKQVAALADCMTKQLPNLKDGDYEAAWNEITDLSAPNAVPAYNAKK